MQSKLAYDKSRRYVGTHEIGINMPDMTKEKADKILNEFKALGVFKTRDGKECGTFLYRIIDGRAHWHSLGVTCAQQVRAIVEISTKYGRDIHINTGG